MIRFGPSGNDELFYEQGHKHTEEAPEWLRGLGLSAYEYSFGRGVRVGEEKARLFSEVFPASGVALSVHAPYFINLAVNDAERIEKNIGYFVDSAKAAKLMGAKRMVFHPGAVTKMERAQAMEYARPLLRRIIGELDAAGLGEITLCAETMGKINQLGTLDEVIELCGVDGRLLPCVDFGHLYARSRGEFNGYDCYKNALDALENGVGRERMKNMHIHFSHIAFTAAGEKMHTTLDDDKWGPDWEPLAQALSEKDAEPVVISESKGTMARDSAKMLDIYNKVRNGIHE